MKKNKNAKARRKGSRPVCFDGTFIGYTGKMFRELRTVAKRCSQASVKRIEKKLKNAKNAKIRAVPA